MMRLSRTTRRSKRRRRSRTSNTSISRIAYGSRQSCRSCSFAHMRATPARASSSPSTSCTSPPANALPASFARICPATGDELRPGAIEHHGGTRAAVLPVREHLTGKKRVTLLIRDRLPKKFPSSCKSTTFKPDLTGECCRDGISTGDNRAEFFWPARFTTLVRLDPVCFHDLKRRKSYDEQRTLDDELRSVRNA